MRPVPIGDGGGTAAGVDTGVVMRSAEQQIRRSETALAERIDGISRRMAQVQRSSLEMSAAVAKLEEKNSKPSVQERLRISELEAANKQLADEDAAAQPPGAQLDEDP